MDSAEADALLRLYGFQRTMRVLGMARKKGQKRATTKPRKVSPKKAQSKQTAPAKQAKAVSKKAPLKGTAVLTLECKNGVLFPPEVMKMVAPEKAAQLAAILADLGITFRIDEDEERICFQADSKNKVVLVGTKCLARLWVHAFAYFTIFTDVVALKVRDPEATLDLRSSDRLRAAAVLLKWAVKADVQVALTNRTGVSSAMLSFPSELEAVFSQEQFAEHKRFADNHAFAALAFILHHELAHIRLGHTAEQGLLSLEQEKAADRMAAEWLLDSPGLNPRALLERQLGITIALAWLASRTVYVGHSSKTHPPAWDRLYQVLEQYVENGSIPWAFAATSLDLHLLNQRRSQIDMERKFDSFKEGLSYYIDVLSRLGEEAT